MEALLVVCDQLILLALPVVQGVVVARQLLLVQFHLLLKLRPQLVTQMLPVAPLINDHDTDSQCEHMQIKQ